jgi:hypothetical protein
MQHLMQLASFTELELGRLAIYKAAVAAGFYTDNSVDPTPADRDRRTGS